MIVLKKVLPALLLGALTLGGIEVPQASADIEVRIAAPVVVVKTKRQKPRARKKAPAAPAPGRETAAAGTARDQLPAAS